MTNWYDDVSEELAEAMIEAQLQPVEDEPCDCLLSDDEIAYIKTFQGYPEPVKLGYDYSKFERLKLCVVVEEGVMRGSGWPQFVRGVKKYLEPRCPSCK